MKRTVCSSFFLEKRWVIDLTAWVIKMDSGERNHTFYLFWGGGRRTANIFYWNVPRKMMASLFKMGITQCVMRILEWPTILTIQELLTASKDSSIFYGIYIHKNAVYWLLTSPYNIDKDFLQKSKKHFPDPKFRKFLKPIFLKPILMNISGTTSFFKKFLA